MLDENAINGLYLRVSIPEEELGRFLVATSCHSLPDCYKSLLQAYHKLFLIYADLIAPNTSCIEFFCTKSFLY